MAIDQIKQRYDDLYKSKYNQLLKNKETNLNELANQETGVVNKYKEVEDVLNKRRQQTEADFYGKRNEAAVQSVRNQQSIRDWMAKNNLLQSGESADALMRNNTDYANSIGRLDVSEQGAYTDIGNQRSAAEREKAQSIASILAKRNQFNSSFLGDVEATRAQIESEKMRDILAWEEQEKQRAFQAEQARLAREFEAQQQAAARRAAASRSSGGGSSRGGSSMGGYSTSDKDGVRSEFASMMQDPNTNVYQWLTQNQNALINILGETEYKQMRSLYNNTNKANAAYAQRQADINYASAGAPTRRPVAVRY